MNVSFNQPSPLSASTDSKPVRLWLKLKGGPGRLQRYSASINGLAAINVIKPPWGVPREESGERLTSKYVAEVVPTLDLSLLRGRNLVCRCPLDAANCHADVLLRMANEGRTGVEDLVFASEEEMRANEASAAARRTAERKQRRKAGKAIRAARAEERAKAKLAKVVAPLPAKANRPVVKPKPLASKRERPEVVVVRRRSFPMR